jgi:transcription initiation factor IIE alpha subunit
LIEKNGRSGNTREMGTPGNKKVEHLESIQKQILDLLGQHKDGLTREEICERSTITEKSVKASLSELRKRGLIYAVDEQRRNDIWRTRYFLSSEILKSNDTEGI